MSPTGIATRIIVAMAVAVSVLEFFKWEGLSSFVLLTWTGLACVGWIRLTRADAAVRDLNETCHRILSLDPRRLP